MDHPNSNAMPIDHGPMAGWDISITRIPHGIDAMDDLCVLDLWVPGADHPAHSFETYRYAYGWDTLQTGLHGGDDEMQAALDWWTTNHATPAYAAHRILTAIDVTTWASHQEITAALRLADDERSPADLYQHAMAVADEHHLTNWRTNREPALVALTPTAYDLIHPGDSDHAAQRQQWFTTALNASATISPPVTTPLNGNRPRAANAFPHITDVNPEPAVPANSQPAPSSPSPTRITR
jgi:hypothetical protein